MLGHDLETSGGREIRIAVVTGTRAEFGILERTLDLLRATPGFLPHLVVAGMHLVKALGATAREVESRFEVAHRVPMHPPEDSPRGMGFAVADGLEGFLGVLSRDRSDLLVVLGDRTEAFAAALAAAYLGVPVAHIHGGDISGNPIDNFQRDAISRIATLHFAATERSAARLRSLAVSGKIDVVGAPGLDRIIAAVPRSREDVAARLELVREHWIVVLHHPLPVEPHRAASEMREVLEAAAILSRELDTEVVIIYPNNDAGHRGSIEQIRRRESAGRVRAFASLPRGDYLELIRHSSLLIGNSSSGIIESAALGLRVVNVGERQRGRERDANVRDSDPQRDDIVDAARRALADPSMDEVLESRRSLYGDGHASVRIVEGIAAFLTTAQAVEVAP